jgi:hypothetical protein
MAGRDGFGSELHCVHLSHTSRIRTRMPSTHSVEPGSKPATESGWIRFVRGLGPYQSLILVLVPLSVVEPLKLIAVAVAGEGHWIAGTVTVVIAYAASLLVVERLFRLAKPKLITLPWFARLWNWYVGQRGKLARWLLPSPAVTPAPERRAVKPEGQ